MSVGVDPVRTIVLILPILIILAVLLVIPVLIGVYVNRDARRRGMNAVVWTLIAVIAPALVGFIIYLLVRGSYPDLECPQCGEGVAEQYVVCPRCGARLRPACPRCSAPVEPDWKVCPRCAAPLEGVGEGVTSPRRRQDKGLKKILIAVIVVPVVLVALAVAGYVVRPQGASGSLQEVGFDEYDQLQPSETVRNAVHRWLEAMGGDTGRAYALRYDLPGEYGYENEHYYLIYVPGGGHGGTTSFGPSSGLFAPYFELGISYTGDSGALFCVEITSEKPAVPKIFLDGKRIRCSVREVDYNPTTFLIYPDYSQLERDQVLFLPERISVTKMERTGKGSSRAVSWAEVTDEDTLFKLMAAIDSGERLDWGHPIYEGSDIGGGFLIQIEYQRYMETLHVFEQDGACYLIDRRIQHGDNFRLMGGDFSGLLESLFA